MQRCSITLIATRHKENGQCTSNALFDIIKQIAPDVIFEEVPPSKFDALYSGLLQDSLETHTIKRYLEKQPIYHIPVDAEIDEITDNLAKSDYNAMVNIFGRYSSEYSNLYNQRQLIADEKGFPYLNSNDWTLLSKHLDMIEEQVIKSFHNEELTRRYNDWINILDFRDNQMISNIYKYVNANKCEKGLFIVGVEHRRKIIDKIQELEIKHYSKLDWNFDYFK